MADNTLLNSGTGGDTIRDLARQAGTVKTQVVALDLGGVTGNAENLITAGQQTMANSVPVVLASNQTAVPVASTTDTTATGNLTALNSTVALNTNGIGTGLFQLSGVWTGTVTFEGSNDNFATSQAIAAIYLAAPQVQSALATVNGFYSVVTAGFAKVQARMSAYTSGTATVLANGSSADRVVVGLQGNADNFLVKASAAVTVAAPTYTTGTTNPLSMTTAGALRTDNSAVTQQVRSPDTLQLLTMLIAEIRYTNLLLQNISGLDLGDAEMIRNDLVSTLN